jgi:hypothetical protein
MAAPFRLPKRRLLDAYPTWWLLFDRLLRERDQAEGDRDTDHAHDERVAVQRGSRGSGSLK